MEARRLGDAEEEILNLLADLASSVGMGEAAGRILGALLLVGSPLSQSEISALTGYSLSVVSMGLSRLEALGVVRVVGRVGRRRLYAATASLLGVIEIFLRERLDRQLVALAKYIREHLSSLSETTKGNVVALLEEAERSRCALQLAAELIMRLRGLSPREFLRALNSLRERAARWGGP